MMEMTNIRVVYHRKVDNPHEYGHFDVEIALEADLGPGDDPDLELEGLLAKARNRVEDEVAETLDYLKEQERQGRILSRLRDLALQMRSGDMPRPLVIESAEEQIDELPAHLQDEQRALLAGAEAEGRIKHAKALIVRLEDCTSPRRLRGCRDEALAAINACAPEEQPALGEQWAEALRSAMESMILASLDWLDDHVDDPPYQTEPSRILGVIADTATLVEMLRGQDAIKFRGRLDELRERYRVRQEEGR